MSANAFQEVLRFVYTGVVEQLDRYSVDLLIAAIRYRRVRFETLTSIPLAAIPCAFRMNYEVIRFVPDPMLNLVKYQL